MKHILIAFVSIFLSINICYGADIWSTYSKVDRGRLFENGYKSEDGFFFTVGIERPKTSSKLSKKSALNRANLIAQSKFTIFLKEKIIWPKEYSVFLKEEIFNQYRISKIDYLISEVIRVEHGKLSGAFYVVLGMPKDKLIAPSLNFSEVLNSIEGSFKSKDKYLDLFMYLEISKAVQNQAVIYAIAQRLSKKYGKNLKSIVLKEPVEKLGQIWLKDITFSYNELLKLNLDDLFRLLNRKPYAPEICLAIGEYFDRKGYKKSALLFFQRGTLWPIKSDSK
ncbi:MAG: hypothetical protein K8R67_16760 [Desulfobacteraceae bacterium]|nr:hypothetical protein [Desulfobacteraceae bacterium]